MGPVKLIWDHPQADYWSHMIERFRAPGSVVIILIQLPALTALGPETVVTPSSLSLSLSLSLNQLPGPYTSRISMSSPHDAPPLPPKPVSEGDNSRAGTPRPPQMLSPPSDNPLFVPPMLASKSLEDLQYLLHSPELMNALFTSTHPTSDQCSAAVSDALTQNINLATRLQALERNLIHLREHAERKLLEAKAMERSWREKEKEMYVALQPFSPPALYNRLMSAVAEADSMSEALEASFLEERGTGKEGAKDIGEFVKEYRTMRKTYHLRKERKERWDEGRIGGWR
ncbi:hypothetical protein BDZ91DRAFT_843652 [Kalaharituber pfeilii]|nr:hypothetical protein BDZ91DRAFT_843652 [Kalaharituber pfeilii]